MVISQGVAVYKGFWPWILKLQALQDVWGGLPWGLTLTWSGNDTADLRPGLFLSVREACPTRSASGQCGPTHRERPTHTHVLLLPAIVLLCALTDGLPDAGIQAVADHMNQLGWKVYDKQWLTYMFLQQSCLPGRTVITPSNYSIFTGITKNCTAARQAAGGHTERRGPRTYVGAGRVLVGMLVEPPGGCVVHLQQRDTALTPHLLRLVHRQEGVKDEVNQTPTHRPGI